MAVSRQRARIGRLLLHRQIDDEQTLAHLHARTIDTRARARAHTHPMKCWSQSHAHAKTKPVAFFNSFLFPPFFKITAEQLVRRFARLDHLPVQLSLAEAQEKCMKIK